VLKLNNRVNVRLLGVSILFLLFAGGALSSEPCPTFVPVDLSGAGAYAGNDSLPFQFPLADDSLFISEEPIRTVFATYGRSNRGYEYHAAEDYGQPPGAPVYAMADGGVSFSGRMDGYGWLVIIDHPEFNLYSLYGHLSPSRWQSETGPVKKGDLIGYIGDSWENGGSREHPMFPHLHLGVRAGQRADYPGKGQWRWMAGWIKPCPKDLGWLQPSVVITGQNIPVGGFHEPKGSFWAKWGIELLLGGIYVFGAACMLVFTMRKRKFFILILAGLAMFAIGWIMNSKGMRVSYALYAMAVLLTVIGTYRFVRRPGVSEGRGKVVLGK